METGKELTRNEMVEEAMRLAASPKESDRNLALLYFKKAIASNGNEHPYFNNVLKLYTYFLEADLGISSYSDNLSSYMLDSVLITSISKHSTKLFGTIKINLDDKDYICTLLKNSPFFDQTLAAFLNKELGKAWVKSLRYDALVEQLKVWEEEDKIDSERLKRIKEILGE